MSMGIGGNDRFHSYSSNKDGGGGLGFYIKRHPKQDNQNEEKEKNDNQSIDLTDEADDDNLEIDMDDMDNIDFS